MGSTIKQRLRRFNGTDYDSVYLSANVGDAVGSLGIGNGGTGATTGAGAAYNLINPMTALGGSGLASEDYLPLLDVSASTGKKVTLQNLATYIKTFIVATISITAPSGSTVTVSYNGSAIDSYTSTGSAHSTTVSAVGTYTVTAVKGSDSSSGTVDVTGEGTFSITLSFKPEYLVNPVVGEEIAWCGSTWVIAHFNTTQVFICKKTAYGTSNTVFNSSGWSSSNLYACRYEGSNLASVASSYASTLSSNYPTDFGYAENYTIHGVSAKIWAPAHGMVCNNSPAPYNDSDGTNNYNQNNTSETGCGTSYYPIFSLFNSARATSDTNRICYNDSGTAVYWWTASAYYRNYVWFVTTGGGADYTFYPYGTNPWFRPFACLTR